MRTLLFFVLIATCHNSLAQMPKDPETGKFTYKEVVEVPGTADQLYFRMKQWLAYNNWQIDIEQPSSYRLQARFRYMDVSRSSAILSGSDRSQAGNEIHAALILEAKNGKIRYTFTDFREAILANSSTSFGMASATYIPLEEAALSKGIIRRGGETMPVFIENLKIYMNKKQDEW